MQGALVIVLTLVTVGLAQAEAAHTRRQAPAAAAAAVADDTENSVAIAEADDAAPSERERDACDDSGDMLGCAMDIFLGNSPRSRGYHKIGKKMILPLLVGILLKVASFVPLILGKLSLLALASIAASKMALLISAIIGTKKLYAANHGHGHSSGGHHDWEHAGSDQHYSYAEAPAAAAYGYPGGYQAYQGYQGYSPAHRRVTPSVATTLASHLAGYGHQGLGRSLDAKVESTDEDAGSGSQPAPSNATSDSSSSSSSPAPTPASTPSLRVRVSSQTATATATATPPSNRTNESEKVIPSKRRGISVGGTGSWTPVVRMRRDLQLQGGPPAPPASPYLVLRGSAAR